MRKNTSTATLCRYKPSMTTARYSVAVTWPITWDDIVAARRRIATHLQPTPVRHYAELDAEVGHGIRVLVKHENHLPTNAFKARNAVSFMTALEPAQRTHGVVAATRGNHGAGLAWAGAQLGIPVVICVPHGNNPEKNAAMRGHGAEVIEAGRDYDEAVEVAKRLVLDRGLVLAHSTNDANVIAGAGTLGAELCEQADSAGRDRRCCRRRLSSGRSARRRARAAPSRRGVRGSGSERLRDPRFVACRHAARP